MAAAPHTPALATDTHAPLSVPPLPTCLDAQPRVYSASGGQGRNRTTDTRIFSPEPKDG